MMYDVEQEFFSCEPGSPEDWIFLKLFVQLETLNDNRFKLWEIVTYTVQKDSVFTY
jgi:hypothetical protein